MNTSYGTVTLAELIWTLSSLPGLLLWLSNLRSARKDLRAVQTLGVVDGRLTWARFAVLKNTAFVSIETAFLLVGLTGMSQPPVLKAPSSLTPTGWAVTICLFGSSVMMTIVGLRWRQVSRYLLETAKLRIVTSGEANDRRIEEAHTPPSGWSMK